MTEEVEGQTSSTEEQPPVEPAPVSEPEEAQLSQPGSQDVVSREEFERAVSELRGNQGEIDKLKHQFATQFEQTAQELGVELTSDQKTELRFRKLEEASTLPVEESPSSDEPQASEDVVITPAIQKLIDDAVAGTKPPATGGSATAMSGGITTLSSGMTVESATAELDNFHRSPISKRTPKDDERVKELMTYLEAEDK